MFGFVIPNKTRPDNAHPCKPETRDAIQNQYDPGAQSELFSKVWGNIHNPGRTVLTN